MDLSISRSLQLKRSSGIFTDLFKEDEKPRNMIEHFMIVGAPPVSDESEIKGPEIITLFPASPLLMSPDDMNQLTSQCFPAGFDKLSAREKKKKKPLFDLYVFKFGGEDTAYYGVCARFKVITQPLPFFANEITAEYPFVFCFITSIPILACHFQFLYFLATSLHKTSEYKLTSVNRKPFPVIRGDTLPNLDRMWGCAIWPGMQPKKVFLNQIYLYRSIAIKRFNEQVFPLTNTLNLLVPAAASDTNLIAQCCLDVLFSHLSIPDIVSIYTNALLGNYIIFVSDEIRELAFAVLAVRAIISPFPFKTPLFPYIPNKDPYIGLLNSPVPYIAGVLKSTDMSEIVLDDNATIVDLETGKIKCPPVVHLPNREGLIKRLKDILEECREKITVPQRSIKKTIFSSPSFNQNYYSFFKNMDMHSMPSQFMYYHYQKYIFDHETTEKVMFAFTNHVAPDINELIAPCFVTDSTDPERPVTVFNRQLFLDTAPADAKEFYHLFSQSAVFANFCDKKTDEVDLIKMSATGIECSPLEIDDEADF